MGLDRKRETFEQMSVEERESIKESMRLFRHPEFTQNPEKFWSTVNSSSTSSEQDKEGSFAKQESTEKTKSSEKRGNVEHQVTSEKKTSYDSLEEHFVKNPFTDIVRDQQSNAAKRWEEITSRFTAWATGKDSPVDPKDKVYYLIKETCNWFKCFILMQILIL